MKTIEGELQKWLDVHSIGRKSRTVEFNRDIVSTIKKHWPCDGPAQGEPWNVTAETVLEFGKRVSHYCPARWNAMVSAIRFITPHGSLLRFRALTIRHFIPPTPIQWAAFLSELDTSRNPVAGLEVRFLALSGLRITEAKAVTWQNILRDRIELPPEITKNGRPRSIPFLPGVETVLARLRALRSAFVLPRGNCKKAISNAAKRAGIDGLSHHDFRHLFATRCIESGVDLPTVARWLGHTDGGALLARTYFHLLDDHSRAMARKVKIAA